MEKQQIVEAIKGLEYIFVPFSQMTRLPFVTCDQESFNDQVWLFDSEADLQAFAKGYTEKKILLAGSKIPKEKYLGFFTSLYSLGVNAVVYQKGQEKLEVEVSDLVPPLDFSKFPKDGEPLMNPSLQLSGIYFMQEMRRLVPEEEKQGLRELQEELNANLVRSSYLMAVEPVDEKNVKVPYVKTKDGAVYQPIFTDAYEYQKFARGRKFRIRKVEFAHLNQYLLETSTGYVINPQGFNLLLQKQQVKK